jgi:hypothetical protein
MGVLQNYVGTRAYPFFFTRFAQSLGRFQQQRIPPRVSQYAVAKTNFSSVGFWEINCGATKGCIEMMNKLSETLPGFTTSPYVVFMADLGAISNLRNVLPNLAADVEPRGLPQGKMIHPFLIVEILDIITNFGGFHADFATLHALWKYV